MIALDGCRTEPLGSYLQALGVWRALVRLTDPDARAHWQGGRLVLTTALDPDDLVAVFRDRFEPLPIVSPWNSGSGFAGNGKSAEAEKALAVVRSSTDPRLQALREGIAAADAAVSLGRDAGWGGEGDDLWDKARKADVIQLCRNRLPDAALPWLDAAAVLGLDERGDQNITFSRLLGTGGNFGRQDLQATYVQRVLALFANSKTSRMSEGWLRGVLFGDESAPYLRESVGQFDPGRAGGIQSSPGEKSDDKGFANPWSFLLSIEGAVLFASAATRRQGAHSARAAVPFMVRASPVGFDSAAAAESASGEIWTPEWERPATLEEISHLLGEGRAEWRGKAAANGLDFVRAISTLGVDRGISRFTRSIFAERLGQNPLAVPVGVIDVRERPPAGLLGSLDAWLAALRRGTLPAGVDARLRGVDAAMYDVARDGTHESVRSLVIALGQLDRAVCRSGAVRTRVRPLVLPDAQAWLDAMSPDTAELRVALALASGREKADYPFPPGGLRCLLTPVEPGDKPKSLRWRVASAPVSDAAGLVSALAQAHRRRAVSGDVPDPASALGEGGESPAIRGVVTTFAYSVRAGLADAQQLVEGSSFRDEQCADYLRGLVLLDWSAATQDLRLAEVKAPPVVHPALALLAPFFGTDPLRVRLLPDGPDHVPLLLRAGANWLSQLNAGSLQSVLEDATARLRAAGIREVIRPRSAALGASGDRLAAALLVPVSSKDRLRALHRAVALPPSDPPTAASKPALANPPLTTEGALA